MISWPRLLLMMFYAPVRGMREVRDRAALVPTLVVALVAKTCFLVFVLWPFLAGKYGRVHFTLAYGVVFQNVINLLTGTLVWVAVSIIFANLFERRRGHLLRIQQDYASVGAAYFYAAAASNCFALVIAALMKFTGVAQFLYLSYFRLIELVQRDSPERAISMVRDPLMIWLMIFVVMGLAIFSAVFTLFAIRVTFRHSWLKTFGIAVGTFAVGTLASVLMMNVLGFVMAMPILMIVLFVVLRGFFAELMSNARRRVSFRQNLESATLNPADSSAHYNIGLLHVDRREIDEAKSRFERAVEIDPEEIDAHFQLGKIARAQNRFADAVNHFEQVVQRDQSHAQHEIWREVGATYLGAGQFENARDVLEKFLDHRPSDPEALYLMGRAYAGLGNRYAAENSLQACIEAVQTAPAYKYRTEKRWLNEAQQFLRELEYVRR